MPPETVVVVSDAHLGHAPEHVGEALRRFLREVPRMAAHLVINGDLFDFWFEYRRVIPRAAFATLAVLREIREQGVRLTVTGGNHDRWGGDFWVRELGAAFHAGAVELELAGRRTFLAHGDGLAENRPLGHLLHRATRHPAVAGLFRLIHPDVGFWLADRLSGVLAKQTRDDAALDRGARVQERYALELLARRPDLALVILGHTHRPALRAVDGGRWYLNPGAWLDGFSFAVLGPDGPELRRFG